MASEKQGGDDELSLDDMSLRPLELSDIDDFMVWMTDDRVSRHTSWESYTSREDGLDFIEKIAIPHPYLRAICWKNRAIGNITVSPAPGENSHKGQLGYALGSKYWGKGITTRAVMMVISDVFNKWPHLERLEALATVENRGSQRVLEKAGFIREGVLRNLFGFLNDVQIHNTYNMRDYKTYPS
ncbi:hypothetical protein Cgig2_001402 [Carnegiea gigantea]|uniref:N-acetyltransferase domain-containing protein n=1 Tax=Carnegiea gigantea TaxID=171969 RepID=A0A9Q1QQ95_9CARY|nr:hypothetical protein Cgig2_001402 [Carnegiea gigantea]